MLHGVYLFSLPCVDAFIDGTDVGHGQSGKNFYYKTKYVVGPLQKLALQAEVPCNVELFYPDGPWPAPGGEELDVRAWGFGDFEHGLIKGLDISALKIVGILDQHGPFSRIMGFSTGAAIAAIIASILERPERIQMLIGDTPTKASWCSSSRNSRQTD
jgi:dihydrofolate reductase